MIAVIDEYRKHGPSVLKKYERPLQRVQSNGVVPDKSRDKVVHYMPQQLARCSLSLSLSLSPQVKTSRDEIAHEISGLKAEVKEVIDKRTTQELTRKQSLLRLNTSDDDDKEDEEDGVSDIDDDDLEQQLLKDRDR